jgi:hypothetical protein
MSQVETAMLILFGATIGFALILFGIWHLRRTPATPGETKLPRLSRKARAAEVPVEISAARLARISGKAPPENPIDAVLQSLATDVERQAHRNEPPLGS